MPIVERSGEGASSWPVLVTGSWQPVTVCPVEKAMAIVVPNMSRTKGDGAYHAYAAKGIWS